MAVSITERAAQEVKRIIEDQSMPDVTALRVGVKGGGCSGFSYTLGFDDNVSPTDQVQQIHEVRVVCDPKSFLYLNGTVVDFEESLMGRGFKFTNPNASKSCGCAPEVFSDLDRFDVRRDTKDLTIFGHRPHFCLGANLARQELRFIIDAALDFLPPGAKLCEDQIEWTRMSMFSRIETLPVDFGG